MTALANRVLVIAARSIDDGDLSVIIVTMICEGCQRAIPANTNLFGKQLGLTPLSLTVENQCSFP